METRITYYQLCRPRGLAVITCQNTLKQPWAEEVGVAAF